MGIDRTGAFGNCIDERDKDLQEYAREKVICLRQGFGAINKKNLRKGGCKYWVTNFFSFLRDRRLIDFGFPPALDLIILPGGFYTGNTRD